MFSQGRRMLAALQQGALESAEQPKNKSNVQPACVTPVEENATPEQSRNGQRYEQLFYVTQAIEKENATLGEQPRNGQLTASVTSVGMDNFTSDGDTSDVSDFTPSERAILNTDWPLNENDPDSEYVTPSSVLTAGRESPQSSGDGRRVEATPMVVRNNLISLHNLTPDDELSKEIPISNNIRKQLFPASNNEMDLMENFDFMPLGTPNYQPLMPVELPSENISAGEVNLYVVPSEPAITYVSESHRPNLEDMFLGPDGNADVPVVPQELLQIEDMQQTIELEQQENVAIPIEVLQQEAEIIIPENAQQDNSTSGKRKRNPTPNSSSPTRKRQKNPNGSKAAIATAAYNSGIAHVTSKGKERKQREVRYGCNAACRQNCQERISHERRQKLFKIYYGSGSKQAQWLMLAKLARQIPVKRHTVSTAASPRRKFSYEYHLTDDANNMISVCQPMFLATFDISITVVQNALRKNSPDKRGKHIANRPNRIPLTLKENVKNHIKSFPTVESHYCRESTKRQYLQENLSISKMYRMYLIGREKNSPETATLRQYRDVFNSCFNLGFYQPKKDQCSLCVSWKDLPEDKRQDNPALMAQYEEHVTAKELARTLKQGSKDLSRSDQNKEGKLKVICFDLQKVFFCPKSEVGDFFYKRKVSCYNFTVFDCTLKKATCCVWDQTIAGRGAVEISSCVFNFIQQEAANGLEELHIYSDSCWSQNKNQILFTMYYVAAQRFNLKIVHRYLEKGHTQMECDSVHASIENKIKKTSIFTPGEWYGFIKTAKVNKPLYTVVEVKTEDIVSFKELSLATFAWQKVQVSKLHEIVVDSKSPGTVSCKKKLSDPPTCFEILVKRPGRPLVCANFKPPQVYSGPLSLKPMLINDLKWMIKQKLIPDRALDFYKSITSPTFGSATFPEGQDSYPDDIPEIVDHDNAALDSLLEASDNAG